MAREAAAVGAAPAASERSLRRDSIAFLGTAGSAVGIQAPSAGVSFLPALMAGIVGTAGPFAFGTAMLVMLFVAYAFVVFTREFASAGSVFAFNGKALGPAYGFVSAWLLLFTYLAYAASVFASNANGVVTLCGRAGRRPGRGHGESANPAGAGGGDRRGVHVHSHGLGRVPGRLPRRTARDHRSDPAAQPRRR